MLPHLNHRESSLLYKWKQPLYKTTPYEHEVYYRRHTLLQWQGGFPGTSNIQEINSFSKIKEVWLDTPSLGRTRILSFMSVTRARETNKIDKYPQKREDTTPTLHYIWDYCSIDILIQESPIQSLFLRLIWAYFNTLRLAFNMLRLE